MAGHTYYYNSETKKSTYVRPIAESKAQPEVIPSYSAGEFAGGFSTSNFTPAFRQTDITRDRRDGFHGQRRNEPQDRPKHRYSIPGCRPWVLVKTKLGRRFVHNTETAESLWKFPEHVMKGVVEFDRKEREKKERRERGEPSEEKEDSEDEKQRKELEELEGDDESSDYTEVEVTDDDENEDDEPSKRQRMDDSALDGPVEFNEDDLAYELEEMDGFGEDEEVSLSEEDCKLLFFELLDDYKISPFSTWEKIIDDGRIIEDDRYSALLNMKSRRLAWDEWSTKRMQEVKEAKEKQAKTDPKVPYFDFLQEHASAKLYWPEFKRKFRKEEVMKTSKMADKDREKWYREYVKRLQLPVGTLKSEFTALLKSIPLSDLNRGTSINSLPPCLLADLRYISLAPSIRDPLIETYISTLGSAPESSQLAEDESSINAKREAREKREKALAERERRAEAAKQRQMKELRFGQARLREEERELERAMNIGRTGIKAQLKNLDNSDDTEE